MISRVVSAILLSLLMACAFGKDEGKNARDDRAAREFDEARTELNVIVGRWTGQLVRPTSTISMQADISGLPVDSGQRDANGRPIYRLDTTIYLTSPDDPIRYAGSFRGTFLPSATTYQVVVSTLAAATGGAGGGSSPSGGTGGTPTGGGQNMNDPGYLQMNLTGSRLVGPLQARNGQLLGTMQLTRVEGSQSGGSDIDEEDRINEIERQFLSKMVGSYYGPVTVEGARACRRYNICVNIRLDRTPTPRGGWKSSLKGHEYREDTARDLGAGERNVSVNYNYHVNPQSVVLTSKGVTEQPSPFPYLVTLTATFPNDNAGKPDLSKMIGAYEVENIGEVGTANLTRMDSCPPRPKEGVCLESVDHSSPPESPTTPSTTSLTCKQAANLVKSKGSIVLSTGEPTPTRFVSKTSSCPRGQQAKKAVAPTKDNARCFIGYVCQPD